jgi:hypothetical protein
MPAHSHAESISVLMEARAQGNIRRPSARIILLPFAEEEKLAVAAFLGCDLARADSGAKFCRIPRCCDGETGRNRQATIWLAGESVSKGTCF